MFAPLAVRVQAGCSAFPFYTPTKPVNTIIFYSQGRSGLPCEFDADLWRPIQNQTLGDN